MLEEVLYFGQRAFIQDRPGLFLCRDEFIISRPALFYALDVRRKLVGRFDQIAVFIGDLTVEDRPERTLKLLRESWEDLLAGELLHLLIGFVDLPAVIFYGSRKISRQYLGAVVVKSDYCSCIGITVFVKYISSYDSEGVSDNSHHMAVLLYILTFRVAHQAPAVYISHARYICKKVVHGSDILSFSQW